MKSETLEALKGLETELNDQLKQVCLIYKSLEEYENCLEQLQNDPPDKELLFKLANEYELEQLTSKIRDRYDAQRRDLTDKAQELLGEDKNRAEDHVFCIGPHQGLTYKIPTNMLKQFFKDLKHHERTYESGSTVSMVRFSLAWGKFVHKETPDALALKENAIIIPPM